ncbi:Prephenate dehydratase-like protein [Elsinoe fawcettii]|nr:Prephenate dehydratase-like protein [Elsinoe fawcettii]
MNDKPASPEEEHSETPRLLQEQSSPAPATVHVAVRAVAEEEAAAEATAEKEAATLGESIAMIANQPEEIPWYEQPCGMTPTETMMQRRRSSLTRPPFAPIIKLTPKKWSEEDWWKRDDEDRATLQHFPPSSQATLTPSSSIASVFTSVQSSETEYGVVPFENSSNGAVLPTLDLFASLPSTHPDVTIVGEQFVDVHHCLLGRLTSPSTGSSLNHQRPFKITSSGFRDGTVPTTDVPAPQSRHQDLHRLKVIHSHPQAWGQCTTLLSSLPGAEKVDSSSTSAAAAKVATLASSSADGTTDEAAIASRLAAEVYDLDILRENIEDRADNQTRFFILARNSAQGTSPAAGDQAIQTGGGQACKTLLHFRVPVHGDPGALADALAVFKKYGLSLSSMYTRPDPAAPEQTLEGQGERRWRYIFFVEFGSAEGQEEQVGMALEELRGVTRGLCVVGRWGRGA